MTTPADIVNQAVALIGGFNNTKPVTGSPPNFDGTPIGVAAGVIYAASVQTVGREWGWDFSRNAVALALTGNPSPMPGYAYEYAYPSMGVQVRQVMPNALADANERAPVNWTVANDLVGGAPTKVILTNQVGALAIFSNQPNESLWDPGFTEAVVRFLASKLAMAIEARPDTAKEMLGTSQVFEQVAEARGES